MKISFSIEYHTNYGEHLLLNVVDANQLHTKLPTDNREVVAKFALASDEGRFWSCTVDYNKKRKLSVRQADAKANGGTGKQTGNQTDELIYFYSVVKDGREVRCEWCQLPHSLTLKGLIAERVSVVDRWIDKPAESYLFTSAFTNCWNKRTLVVCSSPLSAGKLRLKVVALGLHTGEQLALVGSSSLLGEWNTDRAIAMCETSHNVFETDVDANAFAGGAEYKFIIKGKTIEWETGANRKWSFPLPSSGEAVSIEHDAARFSRPLPHFKGTQIPVFSLRSEGSFGIGDFGDLKLFVDWLACVGQDMVQLLPVNDTTLTHTFADSYPYNGISVFAIHPQYADLRQLPAIKNDRDRKLMQRLQRELNSLPAVDYERVNEAKTEYLALIFAQEGKRIQQSKEYKQFVSEQKEWLNPYTDYCYKRDRHQYHRAFYRFVQFVLDCQLRAAHDYATAKGIAMKGDIPIGVNPKGCDVEQYPHLFNLDLQAGAPPDAFAEDGQNWEFPTYSWTEMMRDNCLWWRKRLHHMSRFFDAYRIDHVLGFFRIWEIPLPETSGKEGQFSPSLPLTRQEIEKSGLDADSVLFLPDHRQPHLYHPYIAASETEYYNNLPEKLQKAFRNMADDFFYRRSNRLWREAAMQKLSLLVDETVMLACGEDLGMVPECVPEIMNKLHILSLEVESMPKEMGRLFGDISHYPYLSVATLSSHDMPTLRMWWDEDTERTQVYFEEVMKKSGIAPHPLPAELAKEIIKRMVDSPSMLTILQWQDWLAANGHLRSDDIASERINVPANPHHYWRYRMHLNIEELIAESKTFQ